MPRMIATHEVDDVAHWLASPVREQVLGPIGVTNITTYIDSQNPSRVGLSMDVADVGAVMAFMQTPAAAEAMKGDGVRAETAVFLVEA